MHILFVFENFAMGGVERVTEQLITGLQKHTPCKLSIVCEQQHGELSARFEKLAPVSCLSGQNKFLTFKRICAEIKPDIIVFTKGGLSKYQFFIPKKIKMIAIQHVPINLPQESTIKNTVRRIGATLLYSRLDHVVCVSQGILSNLIAFNVVKGNKASCIYNPVLDPSIKEKARLPVKYDDYFVAVGRLHFQKGYDLLITAIQQVKKEQPNIKVVVVGDGPDKALLAQLIEKNNLNENIILHGSDNNPYKLIAHAKGIILSSRWEGLPTVLVEAAYLQTPIVAFDCRYGPKELTGNGLTGHLVSALDTNSLAQEVSAMNSYGSKKDFPNTSEFLLPAATNNYYSLFESLL